MIVNLPNKDVSNKMRKSLTEHNKKNNNNNSNKGGNSTIRAVVTNIDLRPIIWQAVEKAISP